MFKKIIPYILIGLFIASTSYGVTILQSSQGGTGTGTAPKSGQLLIGNSSSAYTPAYLTAGTLITIATSSGGITISSTGGVGSVTSVNISVPTGLSISGNPITASGTLALSLTSGYVIPLTASTTNWQTAYTWGNHALAGYATTGALVSYPTLTFANSNYLATGTAISTYVARNDWTTHDNYPSNCSSNGVVYGIGDTLSCMSTSTLYTNLGITSGTDIYWTGTSTNLVAATGRTSLGLGDSAVLASSTWIKTETDPLWTASSTNFSNWNLYYQWSGTSTGLTAATGRTSLGLGDSAVLASSTWPTTGFVSTNYVATGTLLGYDYIPYSASNTFAFRANNLSDLSSSTVARTNLGLAIGTNVQAYDANNATTGSAITGFSGVLGYTHGGTGTSTALANQYLWWGNGSGGLVQVASSTFAGGGGVTSLNTFTGAQTLWGTANQLTVTASGTAGLILSLPQSIATSSSPSFTGLTLSGITNGFLKVDANGLLSTSTIDISDNTNLAAGRSLTMSGDSVEADAELYTHSSSFVIRNATTTQNPVAQKQYPLAITITKICGSTSQASSTLQFDERAEATPNTGGTDVLTTALTVGNTTTTCSTGFANAGIAAEAILNLDLDSMLGGSTTTVNISVFYQADD